MAKKNRLFQYYVEGECERRLIEELKTIKGGLIIPGKVSVFNPIQQKFTDLRLRQLKNNTTVVLVFDTDTDNSDILKANIEYLLNYGTIDDVWTVPEVNNFEEEILRCTTAKSLKEVIGCRSDSDFKKRFCSTSNLYEKLSEVEFDIDKLWRMLPKNSGFKDIKNNSDAIFNYTKVKRYYVKTL